MNHWGRHPEGGFTLMEALLASAILAATISAITLPFTTAASNELHDATSSAGVLLGEELMEEILSKPVRDPDGASAPGPEGDEPSRAYFDNVDDYDGYSEEAGEILDSQGNAMTDIRAAHLARNVSVDYVYVQGQDTSASPTFVRITVQVRRGNTTIVSLSRLVYDL